MKKILFSMVAGLLLVSCGSMQQTTTAPTTSNTASDASAQTTQTTTTTTNTNNNASNLEALAGLLGATQTTTQSESYTAGQQSGVALKALYSQYQADGKIDFSNLTNIANILNLSAQVQKIAQAEKGSVNYSDFSQGLIAGSVNLVNELNQEKVVEILTTQVANIDTSKVTEATDKAQSTVNSITETASSLSELINLFK